MSVSKVIAKAVRTVVQSNGKLRRRIQRPNELRHRLKGEIGITGQAATDERALQTEPFRNCLKREIVLLHTV